MQKSVIILISSLLSLFSLNSTAQTFSVCENSEVIFEMEQGYWGEPVFEYSLDSLNWEELDINLNEPFIANEGMSGYYRLRMVDLECDTSFVSMTKYLNISAAPNLDISINSAFLDLVIPMGVDPYFWIYSQDTTLTDVIFHVNDNAIPSEAYSYLITNPDTSFSIHASALHPETGCTVYSDTAYYEVFDPNSTTNAFFDVSGNFSLNDVVVVSQSDSVALQGNPNFSINYSTAIDLDFLYGARTDNPLDSSLLSITIVDPETTEVTIDNEGTAIALVLFHPSLVYSIWTEFTTLSESIPIHESFDDLVQIINQQLQTQGFLNLEDEVLNEYIDLIAMDISGEDGFGFQKGSGFRDNNLPNIQLAEGGNLTYNSGGIDAFFTARFYNNSSGFISPMIVMPPPNSIILTAAAQSIVNAMFSLPEIADALMSPMRVSNLLFASEIEGLQDEYQNIKLRISKGIAFPVISDELLANRLNHIYYFMKVLLTVPSLIAHNLSSGAQLIITYWDIFQGSIDEIFHGADPDYENIAEGILGFAGIILGTITTSTIAVAVSWAIATYFIAKAAYTLSIDIYVYLNSKSSWHELSKVGNTIEHRLLVNSNQNQQFPFEGINGSYTNYGPHFRLQTRKKVYEANDSYEYGNLLLEESAVDLQNVEGFTLAGDISAQEVEMNDGTIIILPGSNNFSYPIDSGENSMKWQLPWDAVDDAFVEFDMKLEINDYWIQDIEGLGPVLEGTIRWNCNVQTPILETQDENPTGELGETIEINTTVSSASNYSIPDGYPVKYEVLSGGGSVSNSNTVTYSNLPQTGLSTTNWTLGEDDEDQQLRVFIVNPNNDDVIVDEIITAEIGPSCDLTNIFTDTRD